MGKSEPSYPPSYCPAKTTYYKTAGYRREAGNTCEGGIDHSGAGKSRFNFKSRFYDFIDFVSDLLINVKVLMIVLLASFQRAEDGLPLLF